jgi:sugar phosphate isomerase/epimerase
MKLEFSLAHLTVLSLSPPEVVDVAARTGYRYVGLRPIAVTADEPTYPLASDRALLKETKGRLAATGIGVLDIELFRLLPEVDLKAFLPVLEVSAELGARHIIAAPWDPDQSRLIDHFAELCDMAKPFGLDVNAEFVTWRETNDLSAAAAIVRAANRSNGAILVDTLHFDRSGCDTKMLKALPREWFKFAQVCDAPKERPDATEGLIYTARHDRRFLGEGGIDVRSILNALPPGIPYSLEIPTTELAKTVGPEERARRAIVAARKYLETAPVH